MKMIISVSIVLLLAINIWFGTTIVRLENFHYGVQVGICRDFDYPLDAPKQWECLNKTETRISFVWHLYYALID